VSAHPALVNARAAWSQRAVTELVRREIEAARQRVRRGKSAPSAGEVAGRVAERFSHLSRVSPRRVVNATGVVIHTNLGRALLSGEAAQAAAGAAEAASDLEFDLESGKRGRRLASLRSLLEVMFPGYGALVVNNNAAAVLLAVNTLARGKEVVISRGQLVEIGGSFRIPDVLERSGAVLREIGTTNRTHPHDYLRAIGDRTGLILEVWPSNYRVVGFTRTVGTAELARMAKEASLPLVVDQGCGRPFRDSCEGLKDPSVEELLSAGASLVCFSGDKVFGGPQAGILIGERDVIARCDRNPLNRALRPDKMCLAALGAVCRAWLSNAPEKHLPTIAALNVSSEELRRRALALARRIRRAVPELEVKVMPSVARVGGGSAPGKDLPGHVVAVYEDGLGEDALMAALRSHETPVIARIHEGRVVFDPRTLRDGDAVTIVQALAATMRGENASHPRR